MSYRIKPRHMAAGLVLSAVAATGSAQYRDEAKPDGITTQSIAIWLGTDYTGKPVATPRDAKGKPILNGYWKLLHEAGKPDGNLAKDLPQFQLPYTAAGKAALAANEKVVDPEARCIITGIPRALTAVLPFEIQHNGVRFATFHQLGWHRLAWLAGRKTPVDPDPRYSGNGIGQWDGDTLVIRSQGYKDSADGRVWADDNANPISSEAVVVERWSRPDYHHLNLEFTLTDPKYYSKPVKYARHFVLAPEGERLKEFSCEWNTYWVSTHLEPGPGRIGADGNRYFGPDKQIVPDWPLGSVEDDGRGTGYWLYRKNKPKPSDLPPKPEAK